MDSSFQDVSFNSCLLSISNQLTREDLKKMKFVLLDCIPQGKLQSVGEPYELFSLMMEHELLAKDNTDLLSELLKSTGKMNLNNVLQAFLAPQPSGTGFDEPPCLPGSLPNKPVHFYGRDQLLNDIVEVLSASNGKRLVLITGLPGYGKSCLSQRIGHAMKEKGCEVIFLCLREVKFVSRMCERILLRLQPTMCLGSRRNQRQLALARLQSLTVKTILVLDNAEDILNESEESKKFHTFVHDVATYTQQVKCVITSRVSYPPPLQVSSFPVKLLSLENEDAAKLLQEKVKENTAAALTVKDDHLKEVARLCLNIPLILHAAAAYMEVVGGPERLIEILRKYSTPLELANMEELCPELRMKTFLSDCLQQLGQNLEEALVSLAVFPAAFHRQQVSIVFGLDQADCSIKVDSILLQLVKRSLVHRDLDSDEYFVHRVIQLCCEEKTKGDDKRLHTCYNQARERFVNYYLELITKLHRDFLRKDRLQETICLYRREEQHIIQAISWATENNTEISTRCAQILNGSVVFLAKVMKRSVFEEIYRSILSAIKDNLSLVADCLTCVGIKLIYSCECHQCCGIISDSSYQVLNRALELYKQDSINEGELVAQCYSKIARCLAKKGDHVTAEQLSGKALEIREKNKDKEPFTYAACCHDRAAVLGMLGKHQEALSLREHALNTYADQLGEHPFTGTLCNYLGNDCLALNKYDKAVEYFSRALSIGRQFFNQETARTFHNLGEAYKMKGDFAKAMENLDSAVDIQDALFDVPHEKIKSLELQREICAHLNNQESKVQDLEKKIQECENEVNRAKEVNNLRLQEILEVASRNSP
ncbi:PREDICTED: uncharacterized protein LOC107358031 [Acropora digitifera]|uniref:uncharacterized protein LOC107358031 n=1 Tax=Acropora digitifera TaxID=70779 RepID=UPI00077AB7FD|nr:PREDICTED: uncharacterized protein LOC107358031 [Acropora digitifera]